jgi:hypothetical protein
VKLRVVSGTAVMVLELTEVLVEDVVTVMRHWQAPVGRLPAPMAASSVGVPH